MKFCESIHTPVCWHETVFDSLSKCIPGWQDFKFVAIFVPPVFGKRTLHIETSEDNLQRGFYRLLRIQGQPDFERVRAQIQPRCNVCGIELAGEQWEINRCHLLKVRGRGGMPEKSDEGKYKRLRVRATSAAARICKLSTSLSGRIYIYNAYQSCCCWKYA